MVGFVEDGCVLIGIVRVAEVIDGAVLDVEVRTISAGVTGDIPGEEDVGSVV